MQKFPTQEKLLTPSLSGAEPAFDIDKVVTWEMQPVMPMLPLGIIFFGATDHTFIHDIRNGHYMEGTLSMADIPAKFFTAGHTFKEIERLAEMNELKLSLPQRQMLRMQFLQVGGRMAVTTRGPFASFVVWGVTPLYDLQPAYADIVKVTEPADEKEGGHTGRTFFRGRVVIPNVEGEEIEQLVVDAPTSSDCATVMAPQLPDTNIRRLRWR